MARRWGRTPVNVLFRLQGKQSLYVLLLVVGRSDVPSLLCRNTADNSLHREAATYITDVTYGALYLDGSVCQVYCCDSVGGRHCMSSVLLWQCIVVAVYCCDSVGERHCISSVLL